MKKVLFIHITKTAGTTLVKNLDIKMINPFSSDYKYESSKKIISFGHLNAELINKEHKNILPDKFYEEAFKFVFIRNPFDRIVSVYHHTHKHHNLDFETYIKRLAKTGLPKKRIRMKYTSRQIDWIPKDIDFIGRFENLQKDFNKLCPKIGIVPFKLKKIMPVKSPNYNREPYKRYYTPETKKMLYDLYHDEIEKFGYKY